MEVLVILLLLVAALALGLYLAFFKLLWTTLQAHRRAMDALHQRIERDRLEEQRRTVQRLAAEQSGAPQPFTGPTVGTGGQW